MLTLTPEAVAAAQNQIITDDENIIREEFKFRKNIEKYPLVYIERGGDGLVDRHLITYIALIQRSDTYDNMGSFLIQLQDGRWSRICSAYLNEMQSEDVSASEPTFDGNGLFG